MTDPEIIPHPLHDAILKHAKHRPMRKVKADWWVRTYRAVGDHFDDPVQERWSPVLAPTSGENLLTGKRFVRLVMQDQESPLDGLEVTDKPGREVLCCTAAEAKRAGLVAVEVPAGGAR
ncbi:hypothetical protein M8C13_04370 [Crossiella sp. SN42]|uniref:hypothetical protein n=1 Tax=Crossiella sp. SN42 TaxID=2944808 RepID=UPI00207D292A|nr:hypothetical protein [Crossiella sp. SN42]MCO1574993.1 hypothetical protein [Crossiella sp. SN42]